MKLLASLMFAVLISGTSFGQTNATDVTVTDCSGTTYNLFTELDAGKIIVIGWTMPCASCAAPLLSVHNAVLGFMGSNPGVVEYWLADDYANSSCQSIANWCTNAGITNAKYFSTSELSMSDYGSAGMPKVVVLGCSSHKVYYNVNNSPSGSGAGSAIGAALADIASSCTAGTTELTASNIEVSCYPNPASTTLNVSVEMESQQELTFEVVGLNGAVYNVVEVAELNSINNDIQLDIEALSSGFYLLKVTGDDGVTVEKFQVK